MGTGRYLSTTLWTGGRNWHARGAAAGTGVTRA
jgi:hypothetical protein